VVVLERVQVVGHGIDTLRLLVKCEVITQHFALTIPPFFLHKAVGTSDMDIKMAKGKTEH
jgi:hypothetical protein